MRPDVPMVAAALWLWLAAVAGCREVPAIADSLAATSGALAVISGMFLLLDVLTLLGKEHS